MINDRILEHVRHYNYLENDIRYDRNYDIDVKLGKFQTVCGTIDRISRNKFYKVMAVPVLSYGCDVWTATKK